MGEKTTPMRCEIVDLQPDRLIQVQEASVDHGKGVSAAITIELADLGQSTKGNLAS